MRLIDHLRLNPMCFNASTDKVDFDASDYIEGSTAFDIGEVADHLIEGVREGKQGAVYTLTTKGTELITLRPAPGDENKQTIDFDQYIGIVPPGDNCFFEYPAKHYTYDSDADLTLLHVGIHLASMSQEWIAAKIPDYKDRGIEFAMFATVFFHNRFHGQHVVGRETVAYVTSNSDGRIISCNIETLLPDGVDRFLPQNQPQSPPIVVMLVALMMLNCRMVKRTLTEPEPKSRQQRRYEEQHPNRAIPPPVRFYTLEIDLDKTGTGASGAGKKSAWEQAWHTVRGHLRHYKSGKVVPVRPYSKGNPLKGIVLKDYKLKGGTAA